MAQRWLTHRPYAALLWSVVGFAVCQLVLAIGVDHRLAAVRDPLFAGQLHRLRICQAQAPGRPLVLMLGSSRTFEGFLAARASSFCVNGEGSGSGTAENSRTPTGASSAPLIFNFGLTSSFSLLELVYLHRLLAAGVRPDLLLIEVLPASLNKLDGRLLEEIWLDAGRLTASELALVQQYHTERRRLVRYWCASRCFACAWYAGELQRHLGLNFSCWAQEPVDSHGRYTGWSGDVTPGDRRWGTAVTRWQYQDSFGEFHLAEGSAQALHELLLCCRQERIPTTLVLMPEGPEFRSWYTPAMRQGLAAFLDELKQEYQVPIADAREWIGEEGFRDSNHLIGAGTVTFTDRFVREVILPDARLARAAGVEIAAGQKRQPASSDLVSESK
jgi:hypothetical protein